MRLPIVYSEDGVPDERAAWPQQKPIFSCFDMHLVLRRITVTFLDKSTMIIPSVHTIPWLRNGAVRSASS